MSMLPSAVVTELRDVVANALDGGRFQERFHRDPLVRSVEILLQGGVLLWLVERDRSGRSTAWLDIAVGVAGFLGSASLFSIRTLDPAGSVHDPGLIIVTLAGLTLLARLVIGARHPAAAVPDPECELVSLPSTMLP